MIQYSRDPKATVDPTAVKILGLGGAGANMLERVALDGNDPSHLAILNTDVRTLDGSMAGEKIQLGTNLTHGLGTGGDPELGEQAVLEAEAEIRKTLSGKKIVFVCAGLGGGTGSGAAPIVTRLAREEGAFVVVFATMPFSFEGRRRNEQASAALNELAVLANALVTFDNNRMGDLVVATKGIHEAFAAADQMVCEAIKAVIRLVTRPGLIHIGLDELVAALRTTRSRCLFGSGVSGGVDRASKALQSALTSPLLDEGSLLKDTGTVLVHLCGGEDLKLYEIELLMQELEKLVPDEAHILFGAAVDTTMGDSVSVTLISSLPEDRLSTSTTTTGPATSKKATESPKAKPAADPTPEKRDKPAPKKEKAKEEAKPQKPSLKKEEPKKEEPKKEEPKKEEPKEEEPKEEEPKEEEPKEEEPVASEPEPPEEPEETEEVAPSPVSVAEFFSPPEEEENESQEEPEEEEEPAAASPKLKLGVKGGGSKSELELDSAPRGRFDGEDPNVVDGEDLDLPPFLRKKK